MDVIVSGVGVIDKSVAVLDAVFGGARTLGELVDVTGLNRATVHRLATALTVQGLLRRHDAGGFALGWRLVALGRAAEAGRGLVDLAQPVLEDLRDRTGESAQLYVREGEHRLCVAASESPHGLRTIVGVGAALPIDRGSAGHVLTGDVPPSGYVTSIAEREVGVASVSAPVRDAHGTVMAAISVSGPIERLGRRPGERYGPDVARAAQSLTESMRPDTGA